MLRRFLGLGATTRLSLNWGCAGSNRFTLRKTLRLENPGSRSDCSCPMTRYAHFFNPLEVSARKKSTFALLSWLIVRVGKACETVNWASILQRSCCLRKEEVLLRCGSYSKEGG